MIDVVQAATGSKVVKGKQVVDFKEFPAPTTDFDDYNLQNDNKCIFDSNPNDDTLESLR